MCGLQPRYLKLEQQLSAGVAAASAIFDPSRAIEHALPEADVMPSLPEAMELVAGVEEDKEVQMLACSDKNNWSQSKQRSFILIATHVLSPKSVHDQQAVCILHISPLNRRCSNCQPACECCSKK